MPTRDLARELGRSRNAVGQRARKLGVDTDRYYSADDIETIRRMYATNTAAQIMAAVPGTTKSGLYQVRRRLGLRKWPDCKHLYEPVRKLHAEGLNDVEIADRLGETRERVHQVRYARLKLPPNEESILEARRRGVKTQQKVLGISAPVQLRMRAIRQFAVDNGWPEDLLPREVQILNVLAVRGPQTALEIARRIGMRTDLRNSVHGGPKLLAGCNRPGAEGTYTGSLMKRGLVMYQHRSRSSGRRGIGRVPGLYMLTAAAVETIQRRLADDTPKSQLA